MQRSSCVSTSHCCTSTDDPHQFALGLTDGSVKIFEPLEPEDKWGVCQAADKGFAAGRSASASTSNHAAEHVQR